MASVSLFSLFYLWFVQDKTKDSGATDVIVPNSSLNFFSNLMYDIFRTSKLLLFEFSELGFVI
nr:hypothetical protein [Mycoplasmopsis bovis]